MSRAIPRNLNTFLCGLLVAASAALAQSPDVTTPARTVRGYLIVVKASVNDHPAVDFLVDTGSNSTLIDPDLANELQLNPVGRLVLNSLATSAPVNRYLLQNLRVGPAAVSNLEALVLPLTQLQAIDAKIRGVVGLNFLLQFSFLLDYQQQRFQVFPFPDQAPIPSGLRVAVEIHDGRILLPAASNVSPHKRWKLSLDSGISELLVFAPRIDAASLELDPCREASCMTHVSTNLARQSVDERRLREMRIADVVFSNVRLVVLRHDQLDPRDPVDGLLPASLFGSVFFDRTNASIIFSPTTPILARR